MEETRVVRTGTGKIKIIMLALGLAQLLNGKTANFRVFLSIILIIAIIIDIYRLRVTNYKEYVILGFFSIILVGIASGIYDKGMIGTYLYLSVCEAIYIKYNNLYKKLYILVNILTYIFSVCIGSLPIDNIHSYINIILIMLFPYLLVLSISIISYTKRKEREKVGILNRELLIQNEKLKEYSKELEKLTIEKERNRVAQELHDSLGHYLMGISMHVNLIEKFDNNEEKRKEIIEKTKVIVKDSITELRATVYKLKEYEKEQKLIWRIIEIEKHLNEAIEFENDIDENIEKVDDNIKEALYITIKEAITNGIKHGEAKYFKIKIYINEETINFSIFNNGKSPIGIKKSNGLRGIEERIENLNGKCEFNILNNGFSITGEIKREEE
ncbi:sensor histidine kinase [Clostridium thermobutyricum]|uniref:sensor histidine kinase n=1 Tax=Clostridium thermobutyricum TaxID=29372 RepID=UPI0018AB928D|nr:histidine kinase [Clostridium thermobutyricum]